MEKNNNGFSLLELMVVIMLIGIISAFAQLSADFIRNSRVSSATAELIADLHQARLYAMTRDGKGAGIRLESPHSYVIFKFIDCNDDYAYDADTCPGNRREEEVLIQKKLPDSLLLTKSDPFTSVNNDVRIFDRFGSPRWPTWGVGGITIVLRSEPNSGLIKCVAISKNRIREGVWTNSTCI
jgi:prepilin-type N-terminal cleavage/methylation domain-containing protein